MKLKALIKNDFWRINYVLPFIKRYQFDEKGKANLMKQVLLAYRHIKVIRVKGKRTVGGDTKRILSCVDISIDIDSHYIYFLDTKKTIAIKGNVLSNFTLSYEKIINGSFKDLFMCAEGKDNYGSEAKLVYEGVMVLAKRIKDELYLSAHPERDRLGFFFERMLTTSAECFDEGLQRILFFNQILWQTRHRLNGLGRLDKILGDLYAKDLASGVLDEEKASELVHDFLLQLSKYPEYKSDALLGDIGQIIILGGLEEDGSYFSNKLTTIFMLEQAKLGKPDPKTLLRVSKNMPYEVLVIAVECLKAKTGSPLFSNDEVVIPVLQNFGVERNDAYNYCVSACWEPLVVGKSLAQNNIAVFDFFSALDEIMYDTTITSFETLVCKYIETNKRNYKAILSYVDAMKWARDPFVSMFTDGASEKRLDIAEGGCQYRNHGVTTVALSNVIDSLLNIKSIVFEERKYKLSELNKIRKQNFEKEEELYKRLQTEAHHFGHDREEVLALVERITSSVSEESKEYRNSLGGTIKFGLSSPGYNMLGKKTAADISGRKAGMPYNTHISCMDANFTEVVGFASKLNYDNQRFNGNVVDFFIDPSFIEMNFDKFVVFMQGAINTGFFQMQMNVINSKTLIDAKAHPESNVGLIVRVWGFSAYFNELPESYKDLMIERAIAAEKVMRV